MPTLKPADVHGLATFLHLLDVNGNGQLELRELIVVGGGGVTEDVGVGGLHLHMFLVSMSMGLQLQQPEYFC